MGKTLAVILGAGASYDCADGSVTPTNQDFRPPLTKHLFDNRPPFNKILSAYPSVEAIADDLRTKVSRGRNLEGLLKALAEKADINRKRQYWEIPLYLQNLLGEVGAHYVISGSTRFHTLVNALVDSEYEKVLFLSLNYDLLLEKALETIMGFQYTNFLSYGRVDSRWCVIKLHGSVHWGKQLLNQPERMDQWRNILQNLKEPPQLGDEIQTLLNWHPASRFVDGRFYYPALGIPFDGKKEFYCPPNHVEVACKFMSECNDYLIIGFSALDIHVLECFRSVNQIHKLRIVNGNRNSGLETLERLKPYVASIRTYWNEWQNCIYDGGFREFTYNDEHLVFLSASMSV